jgi:hypothetical protein
MCHNALLDLLSSHEHTPLRRHSFADRDKFQARGPRAQKVALDHTRTTSADPLRLDSHHASEHNLELTQLHGCP